MGGNLEKVLCIEKLNFRKLASIYGKTVEKRLPYVPDSEEILTIAERMQTIDVHAPHRRYSPAICSWVIRDRAARVATD